MLVPEVASYLEGFMYEIACAKSVLVRRNQKKKNTWKLENMVITIYKTISNINSVFSNCLQIRLHSWIFFTLDVISVR